MKVFSFTWLFLAPVFPFQSSNSKEYFWHYQCLFSPACRQAGLPVSRYASYRVDTNTIGTRMTRIGWIYRILLLFKLFTNSIISFYNWINTGFSCFAGWWITGMIQIFLLCRKKSVCIYQISVIRVPVFPHRRCVHTIVYASGQL